MIIHYVCVVINAVWLMVDYGHTTQHMEYKVAVRMGQWEGGLHER